MMITISYMNNSRVSSKQAESSCLPACKMTHEDALWPELGFTVISSQSWRPLMLFWNGYPLQAASLKLGASLSDSLWSRASYQ